MVNPKLIFLGELVLRIKIALFAASIHSKLNYTSSKKILGVVCLEGGLKARGACFPIKFEFRKNFGLRWAP
jgi:hypothetical protein